MTRGVGVDADVVGDVGCTPTKELNDVVALAPPTVGMLLGQVTRPNIRQGNVGMLNGLVIDLASLIGGGRNGLQEMVINERDIRNELYREKKLKLKDGDAKAMLDETFILQIACGFPCESIFQRCYTDMKFKATQRECTRIMFLHYFQNFVTSDNVIEYTFEDRVWCRNKETKKEYITQYKKNYRVRFDMKTKLVECECSLFNHYGIICCHMIKLYGILGEEVLDRYILRIWRKDVYRKHTCVKVAYYDPSKTEHFVSYDEMQLAFEPICSKAFVFKNTKKLVLEFLELLDIRVLEKRVMIETEILNQTLSSVCLKDKQVGTLASTIAKIKAGCAIPTPESDKLPSSAGNDGNVKDPPRKAKPAHGTTNHRYYSAVEKVIKANPKWKTTATVSKGTSQHINVNQGAILSDIPICPAATQDGRLNVDVPMVDPDGSVGLFFNHAGRTQRVLFPDNQASTNGSNMDLVDTYLKL
ncbi:Protein FAR1-RELATED SEQUENCE 6 [Bienertia sinuspersici]